MNLSLDTHYVARAAARNIDIALDLIVRIDDQVGEIDFTIAAINKLIEALSYDMTREQIAEELGFKKPQT